jgi:hypothetical protein
MKLSTAAIAISAAAAAAVSSVAAAPTSKAGKHASKMSSKAGKAGYLRAPSYSLSYSMSYNNNNNNIIIDTPYNYNINTSTETAESESGMKDCGPCTAGKSANCPDVAEYCEITATFDPTNSDDPIRFTCKVCTNGKCPTISIDNCIGGP